MAVLLPPCIIRLDEAAGPVPILLLTPDVSPDRAMELCLCCCLHLTEIPD